MKKTNLIKISFFALLSIILNNTVFSQEHQEKNLFNSSGLKPHHKPISSIGFYVAPEYQYANTNGNFNSLAGMSFMFMINKRFAIGPSMASTMHNHSGSNAHYGGLKLEYTVLPNSLIHVTFPLIIGRAGNGNNNGFDNDNFGNHNNRNGSFQSDNDGRNHGAFLIQPGVNLEMNVIRFMKVYAGASYRFIGNNINNVSTNPLTSGVSLNAGLKLGVFDYKLNRRKKMMEHHNN